MYQRRQFGFVSFLALAIYGFAAQLMACDTPVYRYAMYRWPSTPYQVYYFHDKPLAEADQTRHQPVTQLTDGEIPLINTAIAPVDLAEKEALERLPAHIREAWTSSKSKPPGYLVASPQQATIFAGELGKKDFQQLVESPARRKIGEHLEAGKACVFVLLEGKSKSEGDGEKDADKGASTSTDPPMTNAKAEKELQTFLASVKSGVIDLTSGPGTTFEDPAAEKTDGPAHEAAMIRVARDDPEERWLIRMLLGVESDLGEFDDPMVFAVYGRARALPPYIGRGITQDNLIDCLQFLTGACSCTVKEQNPGVDLLFSYDWDAAAAAVAEKFGAEEGNEQQLGSSDLFPELIIPGGNEESPDAEATQVAKVGESADPKAEAGEEPLEPAGAPDIGDASKKAKADGGDVKQQAALPRDPSEAPKAEADEASYSIYAVGGGMFLALLVLLAATFIVLRPR